MKYGPFTRKKQVPNQTGKPAVLLIMPILFLLYLAFLVFLAGNTEGGTYTATKHAAEADRAVIGATVPYTTKGHCGHCHEQHASIDGSEPAPPSEEGPSMYLLFRSNYGATRNEACFACHESLNLVGMPLGYGREGIYQGKDKYENSVHDASLQMLWSPDPAPPGPLYHDQGNCNNCHNPHGYGDGQGVIPQMLFAREEALCEACHDGTQGGFTKDVKAQLNKPYSHPAHAHTGRHALPETGQPSGSSFGPESRHAECVDCHNPHTLGGSVHTVPGNTVSEILQNVWGVEPSWPSGWTQPITFTATRPPLYPDGSEFEYQICFKCHSYYGLGIVTEGVSTITGPSNAAITDQAWEFNPNNGSAHPVVTALSNMNGSGFPRALAFDQMLEPWTDVGNQTMYCSDCHGADNEDTTGAKGPHGSNSKYMLKGTGKYWPAKSDGITLWSLNQADAQNTNLFCRNCHPLFSDPLNQGNPTWKNNVHAVGSHQNTNCVTCHVAVPHGSRAGRLIGYADLPAPYDYNDNSLRITSFSKTDPFSYQKINCATECHQ